MDFGCREFCELEVILFKLYSKVYWELEETENEERIF